jgi:hypothetical protein
MSSSLLWDSLREFRYIQAGAAFPKGKKSFSTNITVEMGAKYIQDEN